MSEGTEKPNRKADTEFSVSFLIDIEEQIDNQKKSAL